MQNGSDWAATGRLYFPEQIAGPHTNVLGHSVYYPPNALLLFAPLAALPQPLAAAIWWGVPLAVGAYVVHGFRPAVWAWPVLAALLVWKHAQIVLVVGNSDMWAAAAVAAGLRWGWPAVLLVLKPLWLPLAIIGIRHRSWWLALAVLAAMSLPFLPLWLEWIAVMRNVTNLSDSRPLVIVAPVLIGLVAWIARTDQPLRLRAVRPNGTGGATRDDAEAPEYGKSGGSDWAQARPDGI
jgi:hypothetical protein